MQKISGEDFRHFPDENRIFHPLERHCAPVWTCHTPPSSQRVKLLIKGSLAAHDEPKAYIDLVVHRSDHKRRFAAFASRLYARLSVK
eukprot:CAMPEP_0170194062 /NCGR_PEP_ID=MMETSP0040_2-20121228/58373_1 /TAXON_ID=641309 /ORGANISM="Lotharella oceanica, Strain CCMP622" /LENGTH=86 /DNA_ID=CAMNT_0010442877 /DNA_START=238 /DNA_END=495 /DNA_ORIENTATION=-